MRLEETSTGRQVPIVLLVLGIWMGLVLGLSFIEAPLKFQAPGISTKLGLGIGQLVFSALNKIEIFFCVFLTALLWKKIRIFSNFQCASWGLLLVIVGLQSCVLLPALNERVQQLLAGQVVQDSYHHVIYVVCELVKIVVLGFNFFAILKWKHE